MKDETLLELANKWERNGQEPETEDGSEGAKERNALETGARVALRDCAQQLRELIVLLGD